MHAVCERQHTASPSRQAPQNPQTSGCRSHSQFAQETAPLLAHTRRVRSSSSSAGTYANSSSGAARIAYDGTSQRGPITRSRRLRAGARAGVHAHRSADDALRRRPVMRASSVSFRRPILPGPSFGEARDLAFERQAARAHPSQGPHRCRLCRRRSCRRRSRSSACRRGRCIDGEFVDRPGRTRVRQLDRQSPGSQPRSSSRRPAGGEHRTRSAGDARSAASTPRAGVSEGCGDARNRTTTPPRAV